MEKEQICETCKYDDFCLIKGTRVQVILSEEDGTCHLYIPRELSSDEYDK